MAGYYAVLAVLLFRGSGPVLLRKPIFLWFFRWGSRPPVPPLDPNMAACWCDKYQNLVSWNRFFNCFQLFLKVHPSYYKYLRDLIKGTHQSKLWWQRRLVQGIIYGCLWFKHYSKTCVKEPLSKRQKMVFNTDYCLMQVKSIAECSKGSILQYFWPSLSYQLSLRPLFCLFFEWPFYTGFTV